MELSSICWLKVAIVRLEAAGMRTDRGRKALRYGGAKRHQLMPATTAHAGVVVDTYGIDPG